MIQDITLIIRGEHYLAVMLILVLSCILTSRGVLSNRVKQSNFWVTVIVCTLLVITDVLESIAQLDPARRTLRIITSIAGYTLRPAAILGFLLVVWPPEKPKWFLWIPVALNGLLYTTAAFLPLTFYFDGEYHFHRGPLVGTVYVVCIVYLILVLITIHRRFRDRRGGDTAMIYLCAVGSIGATVIDGVFGGISLISAILISSLVFYLFLRMQDMDHDPLTRLWNRRIFYEDCTKLGSAITAVASVDMNGLKHLNDELGHETGDRALQAIGRAFRSITGKKILTYRVGGDEFMILFVHCSQEEIKNAMLSFTNAIWELGQSVAVGLATSVECNHSLNEMIRVSDWRMYADKSQYYQLHDRRRH